MPPTGETIKRGVGVAGGIFLTYTGARLLWESLFPKPAAHTLLGSGGRAVGRLGRGGDVDPRAMMSRAGVPVPNDVTIHKVKTVDDRVRILRQIVTKYGQDAQMHMLASQILNRRCGSDFCIRQGDGRRETAALFKWVRKNLRYQRDPLRIDAFHSPWMTLQKGGGDCDDLSGFLGALYEAAGYPTKLATVWPVDVPTWSHVYNIVGVGPASKPTEWIGADASVDKPFGWEPPGARESVVSGKPAGMIHKAKYWPV